MAEARPTSSGEQIDPRRFLGPNYCPELRILTGAELLRKYERGHDNDPDSIVWQASFGDVARECLYEKDGSLTLSVGLSGRVISGPKGSSGEVTVPVKVAVVKYQEAVVVDEGYPIAVTIPPSGSTTFAQVHELSVPSPGKQRDYIIYVGFDVGHWDPMHPDVVAAVPVEKPAPVEEPPIVFDEPPPQQQKPKPQPKKPAMGNTLPIPSGGFVLSQ